MFYDNYVKLCNSIGKSPSAVAIEVGIYKSTVSNWKNRGTRPTDATAQKIADYFGVAVAELTGEEQKTKSPAFTSIGGVSLAFYDNYIRLCSAAGKSPSAVAIEIGFTKSNVTYWKRGRNNPSDVTLQRIADYFGVTVAELTAEEQKEKSPAPEGAELDPITKELFEIVNTSDEDELRALLEMARLIKKRREA